MAMTQPIASDRTRAIVGMGLTGVSVARHLQRLGLGFDWYDTRSNPPDIENLTREYPDTRFTVGGQSSWQLGTYTEVIVSPGISLATPAIHQAIEAKAQVIGDIELFARAAEAPVVAITGSNGKSTVTRMVGEMALADQMNAGIGGNLGTPALDLLNEDRQIYVLELSSFQLEALNSLHAEVACILNITQDHLDRYDSLHQYHAAKQRIYRGAQTLIFNRDDLLTQPMATTVQKVVSFGLDAPDLDQYGLLTDGTQQWLARGRQKLLSCDQLALGGRHNWSNALAAYAMATSLGIEESAIQQVLKTFKPLPHRCVEVRDRDGILWIDDSKATNVGAAIAAITGLAANRNVVLIAGGQGKGQDFAPLGEAMAGNVHGLILIGEAAKQLAHVAPADVQPIFAVSMQAAVEVAAEIARSGDVVLLSPACASMDMFKNYMDRGEAFSAAVEALV